MKWEEHTEKGPYWLDLVVADEIICIAYEEGYINWNTFNKARKRMQSHRNTLYIGGLYDQEYIKKENMSKAIEDWN